MSFHTDPKYVDPKYVIQNKADYTKKEFGVLDGNNEVLKATDEGPKHHSNE